MAASFQQAVVEILSSRFLAAAEQFGYRKLVIAGGVSANSGLREKMEDACKRRGYTFVSAASVPMWGQRCHDRFPRIL